MPALLSSRWELGVGEVEELASRAGSAQAAVRSNRASVTRTASKENLLDEPANRNSRAFDKHRNPKVPLSPLEMPYRGRSEKRAKVAARTGSQPRVADNSDGSRPAVACALPRRSASLSARSRDQAQPPHAMPVHGAHDVGKSSKPVSRNLFADDAASHVNSAFVPAHSLLSGLTPTAAQSGNGKGHAPSTTVADKPDYLSKLAAASGGAERAASREPTAVSSTLALATAVYGTKLSSGHRGVARSSSRELANNAHPREGAATNGRIAAAAATTSRGTTPREAAGCARAPASEAASQSPSVASRLVGDKPALQRDPAGVPRHSEPVLRADGRDDGFWALWRGSNEAKLPDEGRDREGLQRPSTADATVWSTRPEPRTAALSHSALPENVDARCRDTWTALPEMLSARTLRSRETSSGAAPLHESAQPNLDSTPIDDASATGGFPSADALIGPTTVSGSDLKLAFRPRVNSFRTREELERTLSSGLDRYARLPSTYRVPALSTRSLPCRRDY